MIVLFGILQGMTPRYFIKADTLYDTRDKCKSIQPLKKDDLAPVPLNIELTKFDRIQILLEIHIAVLSRIVGLS